jgi:hypothetical protein
VAIFKLPWSRAKAKQAKHEGTSARPNQGSHLVPIALPQCVPRANDVAIAGAEQGAREDPARM